MLQRRGTVCAVCLLAYERRPGQQRGGSAEPRARYPQHVITQSIRDPLRP